MANETELALSAFWEVGGMLFAPTSEFVTSADSLEQSVPKLHTKGSQQGWEWLQEHNAPGDARFGGTYLSFILPSLPHPQVTDCVLSQSYAFMKDLASPLMSLPLY